MSGPTECIQVHTTPGGVASLGSSRHVPIHKFCNFAPLSNWNTSYAYRYVQSFRRRVWAIVYNKPERLLDILHAASRDLYPAI